MKLKELKKMLNKASKQQLEQELLFNDTDGYKSGICKVIRQPANLYYTHEDDPASLYTLKQLKEKGMDKEEIDECGIEIPKGAYVVMLNQ